MDLLVLQLSSIGKSSFANDQERRTLLLAAQKLVQNLERPFETTTRMVLREPITMTAVKVGLDSGIFSTIGDKHMNSLQLAQAIG